jgi:CRISPR-associated protein Cmr6
VARPTLLPYPRATRTLAERALAAPESAHPAYFLARLVLWHEGWTTDPPKGSDSRSRGAKPVAFEAAVKAANGPRATELARAALERRRAWLGPLEAAGLARRVRVRSLTPLVAHLVNPGPLDLGLALHWTYGFPVLPASGLKGLSRAQRRDAGLDVEPIYGAQESAAPVAILDGLPISYRVERDVMTPHYPKWYQGRSQTPGDDDNPVPLPFVSVASGAEFEVALVATRAEGAGAALDAVVADLGTAVRERGFGAKTAAGYGVLEVAEGGGETATPHATAPQAEAAPPPPPAPVRTDHERRLAEIAALPVHRVASEIGRHLEWCLGLDDAAHRKQAAEAIVAKIGLKQAREKAKSKDSWKKLLAALEGDA